MTATVIEIYKAQADVLVPVVRALKAELGEEMAHRLVKQALGDHFRKFGAELWKATGDDKGDHLGERGLSLLEIMGGNGTLEFEIDEASEKALKFSVTKCGYAELYKEIGATDLGFLFVCYQDYPLVEGMSRKLVMERPHTIMEGASSCQFNWYVAETEEQATDAMAVEIKEADKRALKIGKPAPST